MMMSRSKSQPVELPDSCHELRQQVRSFLKKEIAAKSFRPSCDAWLSGADPEFSRKLGDNGWLGMTWPTEEGGHGRSQLERFVVIEELLQAGAPVASHWVADRQAGPSLLRFGSPLLRKKYLPAIVSGECFFAIGMSEPGTGSDLASVQSRGERVPGGWRVSGTKLWTSQAHISHAMILLCRTAPLEDDRHAGLSQFIVDMDDPNVSVNPVRLLTGEHHFNEVVLDNVFVADEQVLGDPGNGWKQVTSELAYERSGPERFLSTYPLFRELVSALGDNPAVGAATAVGELVAQYWSLRALSLEVAAALHLGQSPDVEAALVKELGTRFEKTIADVTREYVEAVPELNSDKALERLLAEAILHSPGFTLRGGTNEILRGVIARGLGLR